MLKIGTLGMSEGIARPYSLYAIIKGRQLPYQ
jgi:hypothetical protein